MKPTRGILPCARATSGHAVAPPRRMMKSRRFMLVPHFGRHPSGPHRDIGRAQQCLLWVKSGHSLAMECPLVGTLAVVMARLNLIVIAVRQRKPGASLRTASKGPLIQAF